MEQYIRKSAVVAEIERLKKNEGWCQVGKDTADVYYARGFRFACERIISFLDTLEVKEVDLGKEIEDILNQYYYFPEEAIDTPTVIRITAKHFFELGFKAQKG